MLLYATLLCACGGDGPTAIPSQDVDTAGGDEGGTAEVTRVSYTYHRADGNRLVAGRGALPDAPFVDIALDGVPAWVVAAATGRSSVWAVVLEDGRVQAFRLAGSVYAPVAVGVESLFPGAPPALVIEAGLRPHLLWADAADASILTHPVMLHDGRLAYIAVDGDLVVQTGAESQRLAVDALPDARLLVDEDDRLLLLNKPTARYGHGVLGDALEAAGVVLVETEPNLRVVSQLDFASPLVAEGIMPLWMDLDGDGQRDIIVTLSDEARGARVAVFAEDGTPLGEGRAFSRGFLWRHQLVFATFAGDGVGELAVVRTPHIGGVVEFYRARPGRLEVMAQLDGYTSHVIGSRNLDMALAGDFDGDGILELLLPNQELTHLGAVSRTSFGARLDWRVEIGGRATTNLAALQLDDGRLLVGVGHDGSALRIWIP